MAKIMIDGTSLIRKMTGIEYYTLQIIKNILKYDNENNYIILFKEEIHKELKQYENKAKFLICDNSNQIYCEQVWIPNIIKQENPDVVHFPAFPPGLNVYNKCKNIIFTLHDATMWKYKETTSWKNKLYMKPLSELALKKCKYIFTVSQDSKKNICEIFPKYKEKVVVTSESISEKFTKIYDIERIEKTKQKFNLKDKEYILSVCSLEPRKNIIRLIEAYNISKTPKDNIKLVLVGRKAWGNNEIVNTIDKLNLNEDVIITDYVTDEELIELYNGALCFAYPSLYEGFGLPVLEAMACGIPIVTSNTSSLPEVAGNAALFVNPLNIQEISDNIDIIINNKEIRNKLKEEGNIQLNKFNWETIVNNMIRLYMEVKNE